MFESFTPASRPASRFLSTSLIAHVCAAALLVTLHFAPSIQALPMRAYVSLVAPAPSYYKPARVRHAEPRPIAPPPLAESAPVPRQLAREFHAPAAPSQPAPAKIELAAFAAPEPPRLNLPPAPAEAPRLEHVAPRILKVDNLDAAPVAMAANAAAKVSTRSAGFGAIENAGAGPARRAPLANAGFGDSENAAASTRRGSIATAGFGDAAFTAAAGAPPPRKIEPAAATAVEILSKPRPVYTAEARDLHLEGEVLLEIEFSAAGELHILRVVRGLGHGLDESAAGAARQIRFRPAQRSGAPVDSTAIVHIQFQLAY